MGEIIRVLLIDNNLERANEIKTNLEKIDPDIRIDRPQDVKDFVRFIESNTYDCMMSPETVGELNKTELIQRIHDAIAVLRVLYLGDTRLPPATKHYEKFKGMLPEEDTLSYQLLAKRIRHASVKGLKHPSEGIHLPSTPNVEVRKDEIIIIYENGLEMVWEGEEEGDLEQIAKSMELELRTVHWVRDELERYMSDLSELMRFSGIPENDIPDLLFEGYRSLLTRIRRVDTSVLGG